MLIHAFFAGFLLRNKAILTAIVQPIAHHRNLATPRRLLFAGLGVLPVRTRPGLFVG